MAIKISDKIGYPWLAAGTKEEDEKNEIDGMPIVKSLPLHIGISKDRAKIEIYDSIDEYRHVVLSREQVLALAEEFRELAELMKP